MTHTSIQTNGRIIYTVSLRDRLMPIGLLAFIFFLNILARFVWGPLLVHIENELGISHAGAGAFFLYVTVGYFAGIIASGILSNKMNHRKTISISCYACGLLLVLASLSDSFLVFRIMLVGIGATAGLYLPSAIFPPAYAILSGLVPSGLRNIVIVLLMPLAMLLGGGLFPAVIGAFGDAGRFHSGFLWSGLLIAASSFLALGMNLKSKHTTPLYEDHPVDKYNDSGL